METNCDLTKCRTCGEDILPAKRATLYRTCLSCGDKEAKQVKRTIVPLGKSNYQVITDLSLLKSLNGKGENR